MAVVGLALPVWPTTPFVLIAAGCFSVTPQLRAKIMKIGFFREYIESYSTRKGLTKRTVIVSLAYLWAMLLISMLLIHETWGFVLLSAIGIAVSVHIIYIAKPKPGRQTAAKKEDTI